YINIRKQFSQENHLIFGYEFEDLECEFIIYTNAQPNFYTQKDGVKTLEEGIEEGIVEGNILNLPGNDSESKNYFKIIPGKIKQLKKTLDTASGNKNEISEFLSKLKLFIGQPGQERLGEII